MYYAKLEDGVGSIKYIKNILPCIRRAGCG
jgi:hypothetical protein